MDDNKQRTIEKDSVREIYVSLDPQEAAAGPDPDRLSPYTQKRGMV